MTLAADIAFTAAHQRLIHQVSLAYYAHAAAGARAGSAGRSLADARAVQTAAEQRFSHGVGTVIEVAQAKQATAQAQLAQVEANGARQDAYVTLLAAMGISPLTRIAIADVQRHRLSPALDGDVEKVLSSALGRRPDVLSAYALLKASLAGERAAEAAFLPKVFVAANTSYSTGDLSLTALPSAGADLPPTFNLSGHRAGGRSHRGRHHPAFRRRHAQGGSGPGEGAGGHRARHPGPGQDRRRPADRPRRQ